MTNYSTPLKNSFPIRTTDSNSTISNSESYGIYDYNASPVIDNVTYAENGNQNFYVYSY